MFLRYNLPSIGWALLIVVLSFLPGKDLPEVSILQFDKFVHVVFYLLLFVFTFIGWKKQHNFPKLNAMPGFALFFLCAALGFLIECGQHAFTSDRYFDIYDALANATGALIGLTISPKLKSYFRL